MNTVTSADGTRIAYWCEGSGPPLLLVHGGVCDRLAWYFVVPFLAKNFTVYTFDRRGRGDSGDTFPHSVAREVEDIEAMLAAIGKPAHLLGHSAGGVLSLKAAERASSLLSLTLYEPAFVVNGARQRPGPEVLHRIQALLAAGNRDEVIRIAIRETVGLPESAIDAMAAGPGWDRMCALAHTVPYDWALWDEQFDPARASGMQTRTLMLMGSESPSWLQVAAKAVQAALPDAQLKVLDGQQHSAMITAPQVFAQAVIQFALQG